MRPSDQFFFLSSFLGRFADQILLFIVPLVVFQSTGSVNWAGGAFFVEALPRFVAFPICGILSDNHSPLRLLHVSQLVRAAVCAAGVGAYVLWGGVGWLVALSAICGVMTTQGIIAREVILPRVFAGHPFRQVLSYTQIADQLGTVLGPVVASLLFAVLPWQQVVLCAAGIFLAADAAVTVWQRAAKPQLTTTRRESDWGGSLMKAARHILHRPGLKALVALAAALNLVIGVTLATSAAMVVGLHGQSEFDYAALQASGTVATVLVLLFVARTLLPLPLLGAVSYALVFVGGLITALGSSPWLYSLGYVLIVGLDKMFNIYIRSARQQVIPPDDYGKTTGLIVALSNLPQPLAGLLIATVASSLESTPYIILGCALVMACTKFALMYFTPQRSNP